MAAPLNSEFFVDGPEDGLRGILGIPLNRVEALRQLIRELRACRALAVAAAAGPAVSIAISQATIEAKAAIDLAEARALAAAATPEVQ